MKPALKVLLTLAVLAAVLYFVDWRATLAAAQRISISSFLLVLALAVPVHLFQFLRWRTLALNAGEHVGSAEIQRGYWVGFTLGLLTPGRIGQFGRALALRNCSPARAIGLTVIERFYAAVVINGFGLIAFALLPYFNWAPVVGGPGKWIRVISASTGIAIVLAGVFPVFLKRPFLFIASKLPKFETSREAINTLDHVPPLRGFLLLLLAITALFFTLTQFVLCIRAMGTTIPWVSGLMAALLTLFIKGMLPFTMGSLGIGEWSAMICFQGLAVPAPDAVATSLIVFSINVLIPSLIGIPFLTSLKLPQTPGTSSGKAKHSEAELTSEPMTTTLQRNSCPSS